MKMKSRVCVVMIALTLLLGFVGCGGKEVSPLTGNWAYVHDTETTIISLRKNNTAIYNGSKYTYSLGDEFITLTNDQESIELRYELNRDGFYLYQRSEYQYMGEGTPDSIIGDWYNADKKWSYEFTEEGTFKEDGYFPGNFLLDENASTVKLMYNDHFEDTVIYYSLCGNTLTIDYPWAMVPKK